jgi:hypothetical protein
MYESLAGKFCTALLNLVALEHNPLQRGRKIQHPKLVWNHLCISTKRD